MLSALHGQIYGSPAEGGTWETLPLTAYDARGKLILPGCAIFNALYRRTRAECVQLGYSWSGEPGTEALANALLAELAGGTTVRKFESRDAMAWAIFDEPGKIDAALVIELAVASGVRYSLWTNNTADTWYSITAGDDYHYAKVQAVLEEAVLRTGLGGVSQAPRASRMSAQLKRVPGLTLAGDGVGVVKGGLNTFVDVMGGTLAVFGLTASAVLTMQLVIQEKTSGLLGMLRMAGLRESAFWSSWFVMFLVVQLFSAFLLSIAGLASGVELFSECNFFVHFLSAFLFAAALSSLSLAAAAAVRRPAAAQAVQFALVLFNVLWQMNVASPWAREASYKYPPMDFWNARAMTHPAYSPIWKMVLFLTPVFHYGKILQDIAEVTGVAGGRSDYHSNDPRLENRLPRFFEWGDALEPLGYNESVGFPACSSEDGVNCRGLRMLCDSAGDCDWYDSAGVLVGSWHAPSVMACCGFLLLDSLIFLVVAWYLAQVLGAGSGSSKPWYFLFLPSFWRGARHNAAEGAAVLVDDTLARERAQSQRDGSARLWKLSKSYAESTALKELTLTMASGEIFCLLGHNGAGKSTTINLLTGLHPPTHGDAYIGGLPISTDSAQIQAGMGVCPQDDVLLGSLSGFSHLRFWGRFRGLSRAAVRCEAQRLLDGVALMGVAAAAADTYSGGMKRRLSVAIASMCSPRIVFLDEPTTGLDPLVKIKTWEAIAALKAGRIVCLTTHAMEEADFLGDQIGILSGGRLRALGTPIFLKNRFGTGYHLTVMCEKERTEELAAMLEKSLPGADVSSAVAGHIVVGVSRRIFHLVPALLAQLEDMGEQADVRRNGPWRGISEWSISASTLEEVFLKVAIHSKEVNEGGYDSSDCDLYPGALLCAAEARPILLTVHTNHSAPLHIRGVVSVTCAEDPAQLCWQADRVNLPAPAHEAGAENEVAGLSHVPAKPAAESLPPEPQVLGVPLTQEAAPTKEQEHPASQAGPIAARAVPSASPLPPPKDELPEPSPLLSQTRGLLLKFATLQKQQRWANGCRCLCTVGLVVLNLILMVLINLTSHVHTGSDICPGNFLIVSDEFWAYANTAGAGGSCRRSDFAPYLAAGGQCNETRVTLSQEANASSAIFEAMIGQNFRDSLSKARSGAAVCDASLDATGGSGTCPAGGSPDIHSACAPALHIPRLCALKTVGLYTPEKELEQWQAALPASDALAEAMANLTIWHDGGLDDTWLGGLGSGGFIFSNHGDENALSHEFPCGAVRLDVREVTDVHVEGWQQQEALRGLAYHPSELPCSFGDDDNTLENFGVDAGSPDELVAFLDGDVYEALGDFYGRFPDIAISSIQDPDQDGRAAYSLWVVLPPASGSRARAHPAESRASGLKHAYKGARKGTYGVEKQHEDQHQYPFLRAAFRRNSSTTSCGLLHVSPTPPETVHTVVNMLSNGLERKLWEGANLAGEPPRLEARLLSLPKFEQIGGQNEDSLRTVLTFLPMVTMLFFPAITQTVQQEISEKNVLAMRLQSLRVATYWLATYFSSQLLYWSVVSVYWISGVGMGLDVFAHTDHGSLFIVLLLWSHAQIALAIFLGSALGDSAITPVLCYMLLIATIIAGPCVMTLEQVTAGRWPGWLFLLPPANFSRALVLVLARPAGQLIDDEAAELAEACGLQFFTGTLLLIVGVGLHEFAVHGALSGGGVGIRAWLAVLVGRQRIPSKVEVSEADDEDVVAEASRLQEGHASNDRVQVKNLVKEFPGGFTAVRGVSFGIPVGECFGLLGPNGAGKTTVISVLSGSQRASGGEATICGFDVRTKLPLVHRVIGICPQFDIVWKELNVLDHLLLFARLKGVPRGQEKLAAQKVAEAAGIDGDPLRTAASKLSGGMRRRLSLGIALIGNPRVAFLDEPSTGLDPETRRSLWRIVAGVTPGRSVVLTTHSMEEADTLCHRIGIMVRGRLRCLGSAPRLKSRFGQGYRLTLAPGFPPADPRKQTANDATQESAGDEALDEFVRRELAWDATPVTSWQGARLRTYALPAEGLRVSRVFETMTEKVCRELGVQEWSLNQTSLNEVMLRVASEVPI